jgi:hypothetical protein
MDEESTLTDPAWRHKIAQIYSSDEYPVLHDDLGTIVIGLG